MTSRMFGALELTESALSFPVGGGTAVPRSSHGWGHRVPDRPTSCRVHRERHHPAATASPAVDPGRARTPTPRPAARNWADAMARCTATGPRSETGGLRGAEVRNLRSTSHSLVHLGPTSAPRNHHEHRAQPDEE